MYIAAKLLHTPAKLSLCLLFDFYSGVWCSCSGLRTMHCGEIYLPIGPLSSEGYLKRRRLTDLQSISNHPAHGLLNLPLGIYDLWLSAISASYFAYLFPNWNKKSMQPRVKTLAKFITTSFTASYAVNIVVQLLMMSWYPMRTCGRLFHDRRQQGSIDE